MNEIYIFVSSWASGVYILGALNAVTSNNKTIVNKEDLSEKFDIEVFTSFIATNNSFKDQIESRY